MKKEVAVIFILILFSSLSFAIQFEGNRNICLSLEELNVQISFYPEIYKIYVATYNPHNESIYNMSFHVLTVDTNSHNIFTGKHIEFEIISPDEFAHKLLDFDFEYNKPSRVMVYGLEFILKNKPEKYNDVTSPENFTVHRCMDINRWYRETVFSFNGKKDVEDEIIFKKLCNETFYLILFFPESSGLYIPVKHAEIIYDEHNLPLEIVTHEPKQRIIEVHEASNYNDIRRVDVKYEKNLSQRRSIEIVMPLELPTNKPLKLKLGYHLRTQFPIEDISWSVPLINTSLDLSYWSYPFVGISYELDTGDITLNEVYVSPLKGERENVTSVELYTHELYLPSGFTSVKDEKTTSNNKTYTEGSIAPPLFSPDQNCLKSNKSKVPGLPYIQPTPTESPTQDEIKGKLIWSSKIIDRQPNWLSFQSINEPDLYRFIYLIFLVSSLIFLLFFRHSFLMYLPIYLLIRLALPIPQVLTLFDITAGFFFMLSLTVVYIFPIIKRVASTFSSIVKRKKEAPDEEIGEEESFEDEIGAVPDEKVTEESLEEVGEEEKSKCPYKL